MLRPLHPSIHSFVHPISHTDLVSLFFLIHFLPSTRTSQTKIIPGCAKPKVEAHPLLVPGGPHSFLTSPQVSSFPFFLCFQYPSLFIQISRYKNLVRFEGWSFGHGSSKPSEMSFPMVSKAVDSMLRTNLMSASFFQQHHLFFENE